MYLSSTNTTLKYLTSCVVLPCVFPLQLFFLAVPAHLSVSPCGPPLWLLWWPDRRLSPGNNVSAQSRHTLSLQQVSRTLHTAPLLGERGRGRITVKGSGSLLQGTEPFSNFVCLFVCLFFKSSKADSTIQPQVKGKLLQRNKLKVKNCSRAIMTLVIKRWQTLILSLMYAMISQHDKPICLKGKVKTTGIYKIEQVAKTWSLISSSK